MNGNVRFQVEAPVDADEAQVKAMVMADEYLAKYTSGRNLERFVLVPSGSSTWSCAEGGLLNAGPATGQ